MTDRLLEIAHKIQQRPWSQPGTDKSWVLRAMWERQRFQREIRRGRCPKDAEFLRAFEARLAEEDA